MNELYKIAFDTIAHIIRKWNNDEEAQQADFEYLAEIENCVNAVGELPDNATNGDVIKALFPNISRYKNTLLENHSKNILFDDTWWNAPYKGGTT